MTFYGNPGMSKFPLPWAHSSSEGLDLPGLCLDLVEVEDLLVVLLCPRWQKLERDL